MHNKWIATKDKIILSRVDYHKDIAKTHNIDKSKILGGGLWEFDDSKKEFTLFGESFDFGCVGEEKTRELINTVGVWDHGRKKISDDFSCIVGSMSF